MIRLATPDDLPELVAMGARFLRETPRYARWFVPSPPFIYAWLSEILARQQSPGDTIFLVLGEPGDVHGMMAGIARRHDSSGTLTAAELFWWVEPERRGGGHRLYRGFMRWAKAMDCELVQMTANSGKVRRLYKRLGYEPLEEVYIKRI